jgi:hypothetical protein
MDSWYLRRSTNNLTAEVRTRLLMSQQQITYIDVVITTPQGQSTWHKD